MYMCVWRRECVVTASSYAPIDPGKPSTQGGPKLLLEGVKPTSIH